MTAVLYAKWYGRFVEIKSNLDREKLHRTKQVSNFPGSSFSYGDNVRVQSSLEEKGNPRILHDDFSSRTDPFIFTSVAPELLEQSTVIIQLFQH